MYGVLPAIIYIMMILYIPSSQSFGLHPISFLDTPAQVPWIGHSLIISDVPHPHVMLHGLFSTHPDQRDVPKEVNAMGFLQHGFLG